MKGNSVEVGGGRIIKKKSKLAREDAPGTDAKEAADKKRIKATLVTNEAKANNEDIQDSTKKTISTKKI